MTESWEYGRECISSEYKIKCNRISGNMEQEVAHSGGGYNSRRALKGSGGMTLMVHIYIENGSPVLRYRKLVGALELMGFLVRCAGKDGFLRLNVSNSYQQHSVWMRELEVG